MEPRAPSQLGWEFVCGVAGCLARARWGRPGRLEQQPALARLRRHGVAEADRRNDGELLADPANLAAEWVAITTTAQTEPNYSFYRQAFCTPLNAGGLNASLQ